MRTLRKLLSPRLETQAGEYRDLQLIAQLVKNLLAMQETPVRFLSREDLLEKGMATNSSILAWRIPWTV